MRAKKVKERARGGGTSPVCAAVSDGQEGRPKGTLAVSLPRRLGNDVQDFRSVQSAIPRNSAIWNANLCQPAELATSHLSQLSASPTFYILFY